MDMIIMSNFSFTLTGSGRQMLRGAIEIAMAGTHQRSATTWGKRALTTQDNGPSELFLFGSYVGKAPLLEDIFPFPSPLDLEGITECVWQFLQEVKMPPQPSGDGSSTADGFKLHGADFGGRFPGGFLRVQPEWRYCAK